MKATIKVPVTTTQEVEVQLPQFRKIGNEYHAIYGTDSYDNIYFRIYNEKLICFMAFSDLNNVSKGVEITKKEFEKAFNDFKQTINVNGVDAKGDYYVEDDCSTKSEDGGNEGFNEFVKENY